MKKILNLVLFSLSVFFMVPVLFSCRTAKVSIPESFVHPLALLSSDCSIYINVPVQQHKELSKVILSGLVPELNQKNAELVVSRIDNLYCGLGTVKELSHLEISCFADIPQVAGKAVFTKKNGFIHQIYQSKNGNVYDYWMAGDSGYNLSFPDSNHLIAGQKLFPMFENLSVQAQVADTPYNEWISAENTDILFYITRPGQYLRNLLGQSVTIGVGSVYGSLSEVKSKYYLTLKLELLDKRHMPAFRSMLGLSFAMMGGNVRQIDQTVLELSGVEISMNQIKSMFMREDVSGSHYKVVGDDIIQEKIK